MDETGSSARDRARPALWIALGSLVVAAAIGIVVGPGDLGDPELRATLITLRAWRLAAAALTGAALAVGGAVVQGLFRNPLADPSILGSTAGASLGGQAALVLYAAWLAGGDTGPVPPGALLPVGCLLGAFLALGAILVIARKEPDRMVLLLSGFILTALFLGVGNFLLSAAQESWELGRAMVSFVMGGLSGTGGEQVRAAAPLVIAGVAASWFWGRPLDLLLSGDEESRALGVDVGAARRWGIVWVAVLTGAAVSLGGNIGFVGLVVPHVLRPFTGWEHRALVPASALAGAAFVVACDVLARVIPTRTELPLGVITGLVGAPLFLWLLLRSYREVVHE
jgi:iron complex transport system permease protein